MALRTAASDLFRSQSSMEFLAKRLFNSNSGSVTKIHRKTYTRTYPTVLVMPDGASIQIRYHEPRQIIKLPFDMSGLTDAEKKLRMERRKPKEKIKIDEDFDDEFDATKYLNLTKPKK